jgi:hypothetical protein
MTTEMSPVSGEADVARLREVAKAATLHPKNSLPWLVDDDENDKPLIVLAPKDVGGWDGIVVARCLKPEDALHIATFDPPTVLALLARLEAAEKALAVVERVRALAEEWEAACNPISGTCTPERHHRRLRAALIPSACGSCGDPAPYTITLHGEPMSVCLRHLNHWRTPCGGEEER